MKKRKKQYIIAIIIFICLFFLIMHFTKYDFLQEDLLFFQLFNSNNQIKSIIDTNEQKRKEQTNEKETSIKNIYFNVQYQNTKFEALNLTETVDKKTLIYEKIAPGTNGRFDILLESNQNMNYQIRFESKNEKPNNLQFYTLQEGKRYQSLEELGKTLAGTISENEQKTIPIYWEWEYEKDIQQDKKDTLEAKKIREYHFLIYVQGY